jgi:hypothetical protein
MTVRLLILVMLALLVAPLSVQGADQEGIEFFEAKIRPLLIRRCFDCHSGEPGQMEGGLRLDSREAVLKGGESGPVLVAGKPDLSLLIKAVRRLDKDLSMPPDEELPAAEVNLLVEWVRRGAPDPRTSGPSTGATPSTTKKIDYDAARKQWAFHAPQAAQVPAVQNSAWAKNEIDRFILARLESRGLKPADLADKRTLIRRATFDLTGLPPTPDDVAAFLADDSVDAFGKVTERLLASPAYGEQWGRHWLDVVRYADSLDARGSGKEGDILDAWRYRDWVVNAFNRDLPYDEFVTQQVAGDILAGQQWDQDKVIATGLYAIGNWGNGDADKEKLYTDIVDDQVDLTGRAFLGLTIACARCHDHKFDPLTTADYYSLAGIFFSSRILEKFASKTAGESMMRIPLLTPEEVAQRRDVKQRIERLDAQLAGGLRPFTEVKRDVQGKPGLVGWHPKSADNPSLAINTTGSEVAYLTIKLPANAIALHPGPKSAVTAAWRSPLAGKVRVNASLRDVDPTCGDGVAWAVRHKGRTIGSGVLANGAQGELAETEVTVAVGDLLQLVISPRGNYSCDSTQTNFVIRAADDRVWDLRQALVGGATQGQDETWWICEGEGDRLAQDASQDLAAVDAERKQLAAQLAPPAACQGMQEGGILGTAYTGFHDARVHVRGRYDRLGEVRPRGFPVLLAGELPPKINAGSGRLELARWLASPQNPLTARVMVNRLWQHHFGEGIVRTPNNYGKLGTPPTHPELLDWLALEFARSGWSIKAMHRRMMLSAAYQQSSRGERETVRIDPANELFGRQNRQRLTAEELRDTMLNLSGELDRVLGGPSVRDLAAKRRTLYVTTIRSDRATYQMLFDGADPNTIVEKRTDSVVAPQALWLLNHPFALAQIKALADRLEREGPKATEARVEWLYERLFARLPRAEERELMASAVRRLGEGTKTWEQICQVLVCSNELAYLD